MHHHLGQLTPESVEKASGDETAPTIEAAHGGILDNASLTNYVDEIGQRARSGSTRRAYPHQFRVLAAEKVINAFALGNGNVYVTKGLLNLLDDEAELAFVLSHEIGHVEKRHIAYAIDQAVSAGLILSIVEGLATSQSQSAKDLVGAFGSAAADVVLLGFGRERELEADELGLEHSAGAGYDPYGAVRVFRKFQTLAPESAGLQIYMDSHPTASRRISDLEAEIRMKFPDGTGATRANRFKSIVKEGVPYSPLPIEEAAKYTGSGSSVAIPIAAGALIVAGAGVLLA